MWWGYVAFFSFKILEEFIQCSAVWEINLAIKHACACLASSSQPHGGHERTCVRIYTTVYTVLDLCFQLRWVMYVHVNTYMYCIDTKT